MMVFTTPCYVKFDLLMRGLIGMLLVCWIGLAGSAQASDKSIVKQAIILATPQGYTLDADIGVVLNSTLENALTKGINLYFLLELEITRPRNWWLDETIAEPVRKQRIYYHLLLRRYVVEIGYTTRTVATLNEALEMLGTAEAWQILERGALKAGQHYDARLRLRLDTSQLPKPLSIGAVSGDKWELVTPWYEWSFDAPVAPVPTPAPAPAPLQPLP